jgi:hypothetical protein
VKYKALLLLGSVLWLALALPQQQPQQLLLQEWCRQQLGVMLQLLPQRKRTN